MKCFKHPKQDAVGSCVTCGKGLCGECYDLTESKKLVCSEECAQSVATDEKLVTLATTTHTKSNRLTSWFLLGSGVVFLAIAAGEFSFGEPEECQP